jgi:hypothetical protein
MLQFLNPNFKRISYKNILLLKFQKHTPARRGESHRPKIATTGVEAVQ